MSPRRLCLLFFVLFLIIGCAGSAKKINQVQLGMTKEAVIGVMGNPSYVSARENTEFLNYKLVTDSVFPDDYFVRLTDGKVDLFGRRGDFGIIY